MGVSVTPTMIAALMNGVSSSALVNACVLSRVHKVGGGSVLNIKTARNNMSVSTQTFARYVSTQDVIAAHQGRYA